jgi:hypothetical protein
MVPHLRTIWTSNANLIGKKKTKTQKKIVLKKIQANWSGEPLKSGLIFKICNSLNHGLLFNKEA